jgi:DNA-binding response OmpR family regulator
LGSVLFDAKNRKLIINGKTIDLTGTETRVLLIFALSPNEDHREKPAAKRDMGR